jgi:DNA-binding NarL/FixJ family response regulator
MKTKILLADDHQLLLDGLRPLLDGYVDIDVVGVAKDGMQAVELARSLNPDIVLLDISMPQLNGIDAARRILQDSPDIKIIMLSMHSDRQFVHESLRNGARGYVLKESAFQDVAEAVLAVLRGELYLSPALRDRALTDYVEHLKQSDQPPSVPLTGREREVLQLIAEGNSTKQTADLLSVSVKTVESHRKQIMDKLNLHSIAEITKYAIRHGLTQLD